MFFLMTAKHFTSFLHTPNYKTTKNIRLNFPKFHRKRNCKCLELMNGIVNALPSADTFLFSFTTRYAMCGRKMYQINYVLSNRNISYQNKNYTYTIICYVLSLKIRRRTQYNSQVERCEKSFLKKRSKTHINKIISNDWKIESLVTLEVFSSS